MDQLITPQDWMHADWHPPTSWFQSRAYWRAAADYVADRPDLVEQAISAVREVLARPHRDHGYPYYVEWLDILRAGPVAIAQVLRAPDDDHSQVLRSMCPLRGLVSQEDRAQIYNAVARELELARHEDETVALRVG